MLTEYTTGPCKSWVRPGCGIAISLRGFAESCAPLTLLKPLVDKVFHQIHTHEVTGSSPVGPINQTAVSPPIRAGAPEHNLNSP